MNTSEYWAALLRRQPPQGAPVVPGTIPVAAFGNPFDCAVASIGINPSRKEFVDDAGIALEGATRRLPTLASLGATDPGALTDSQVLTAAGEFGDYFLRNPYRSWFDPLDRVITGVLGSGFYDGEACHLDLVQWATDPVWGRLDDPTAAQALLEESVPHITALLNAADLDVVLCNGRQVLNQVKANNIVNLKEAGSIPLNKTTCALYSGRREDEVWVGWSTNLQSSWGVSSAFIERLIDAMGRLVGMARGPRVVEGPTPNGGTRSEAVFFDLAGQMTTPTRAATAEITELTDDGTVLMRTYGTLGTEHEHDGTAPVASEPGGIATWTAMDGPRSGEFCEFHLPLTLQGIPDVADEEATSLFALSFDGYAAFGEHAADVAERARQRFEDSSRVPEDLAMVRCCLFMEQRGAHHRGDGLQSDYVRALMSQIVTLLKTQSELGLDG